MNDWKITASPKPVEKVQVLVVGAGPAGSTTAALIAQGGIDVLLVDKATFPREKICGDGLTPRSVAAIKQMGLLPRLEEAGALPVKGARIVAPDGQRIDVGFDEIEDKYPPFGLTIPRKTLDSVLLQYAQDSGARFVGAFRVREWIERDGAIAGVRGLWDGDVAEIHAPLTCLATGGAVPLVKQAGLLATAPPLIRAARAYFSGAEGLEPLFQLIFDRELIPGYGWIFPMHGGMANIGAGVFQEGRFARQAVSPKSLFDLFIERSSIAGRYLTGYRMEGKVESYPLRADFLTAQTFRNGLLLVGEAAGLVNPVNGEGVDYALESGLLAAQAASDAVKVCNFGQGQLEGYNRLLQERYHSFFYYLTRMRKWYIRERVINTILHKARRRPDLKYLFVSAALGLIDPRDALSWGTIGEILF